MNTHGSSPPITLYPLPTWLLHIYLHILIYLFPFQLKFKWMTAGICLIHCLSQQTWSMVNHQQIFKSGSCALITLHGSIRHRPTWWDLLGFIYPCSSSLPQNCPRFTLAHDTKKLENESYSIWKGSILYISLKGNGKKVSSQIPKLMCTRI